MTVKNIRGVHPESIEVTTSANTWHLLRNAAINSLDYGFLGRTGATNNIFNIDGDIHSATGGVFCDGNRLTVNLGKTGAMAGQYGIKMAGTEQFNADIDGSIVANQYGIATTSAETKIEVGKTGSIDAMDGIHSTGATSFVANIDGRVFGAQDGLFAAAANAKVHIGGHGSVDGGRHGIYFAGADSTITNDGRISGPSNYGVYAPQPGLEIRNHGEISGQVGVFSTGDGSLIVNGEDGMISGALYGILLSTAAGESSKIVNHGTILGSRSYGAVFGGTGDDEIVSDGRLIGTVFLYDGNDTLNVIRGSVKGTISGGIGDDTLITDKASHKLGEMAGEGIDTVRSTVSYTLSDYVENLFLIGDKNINGVGTNGDDALHGNSGDNTLRGHAGLDHLYGNKGTDLLFGGGDADYFHVSTGDGHDRIMDFEDTVDQIDVSAWGPINTIGDVLDQAHNQGDGVMIEAGGVSLFIKGVAKADLDAMDFGF